MNANKIGTFILSLRKEKNLTQQEFADMFNVTYQAVSKWENGKNIPDLLILKEICKKFNVDIDELLDGEKKRKKKTTHILIALGVLAIFISLSILFIRHFDSSSFEFKTLSTTCSNFNISGSVAYNKAKSSIYISNIEYCGGNDKNKYKSIECILYETDGDTDVKINSYISKETNTTLEHFLKKVSFHVDNYSKICDHSMIFLQINAIDNHNNAISYKIPLEFASKCSI